MRVAPVLLAALIWAPPPQAQAGASAWVDLGAGARVRLVSADVLSAPGRTMAALDLEMPAQTKTYWRTPGETGLAAAFDVSGSTGIGGVEARWPFPLVEVLDGHTDFVYYGRVVIPLELEVTGDRAVLELAATLGVCSDVCIPARARLSLPLDFSRPDPAQQLRIEQALATVPLPWMGDADVIGDVLFEHGTGELVVWVDAATIEAGSVLAEALEAPLAFGAPQKSPERGIVRLPAMARTDGGPIGKVRLTFMTSDGPYELIRMVRPST